MREVVLLAEIQVIAKPFHIEITQPLLLEQLRETGVDISAGQLNNILIEKKDDFHQEKDYIFAAGLEVSSYVNVDETVARHQGKNGTCTHIGNEWFSWFESTATKSRINFLRLLWAERLDQFFDEIFTTKTHSASLNNALKRIYNNKAELLLLLRHPEIPLHNNLSENGIRERLLQKSPEPSSTSFPRRRK
jgi:hypothetical protein